MEMLTSFAVGIWLFQEELMDPKSTSCSQPEVQLYLWNNHKISYKEFFFAILLKIRSWFFSLIVVNTRKINGQRMVLSIIKNSIWIQGPKPFERGHNSHKDLWLLIFFIVKSIKSSEIVISFSNFDQQGMYFNYWDHYIKVKIFHKSNHHF